MTNRRCARLLSLLVIAGAPAAAISADDNESALLTNIRQLTFEGKRSGEGYFSADGSKLIFQSEREPDNPFFQIYLLDLTTGDTRRVSPGVGKTTCAWVHPDGTRALFASTHDDPKARQKQKDEIEFRQSGKSRRYSWDFDEHFEIYETSLADGGYRNLTQARGYDAEGSYSPDGERIAFASNRHAYAESQSDELKQRLETDPSYFLELYIMDADGGNPRRLTDTPGYDGGPFFSADGRRICWRRFSPDGSTAQIWTADIDGSNAKQITRLDAMSWAPYFHPSGDYLFFTTNLLGFSNFELFMVDDAGKHEPVRVTYTDGFDGLPVFHPDGKQLAWTSNRTANGASQIFLAKFAESAARRLLEIDRSRDDRSLAGESPRAGATLTSNIRASDLMMLEADYAELRITGETAESKLRSVAKRIGLTRHAAGSAQRVLDSGQLLGRLEAAGEPTAHLLIVATDTAGKGWPAGAAAYVTEIADFLKEDKQGRQQAITFVIMRGGCDGASESALNVDGYDAIIELICHDKPNRSVHVWGAGTSSQWPAEIERRNVPVGLPLSVSAETKDTCAARLAQKKGIACLQIEAGPITSDAAVAERAESVTRLTALIAQSIARAEERLDYKSVERRTPKPKQPYLGTEPDYAGDEKGVKINGVTANGPAEQGGMKPGDVIIEIDGQPIENINAYAAALDTLNVGQTTIVTVRRGDQRVKLRITVGARE